MAKKLTEAEQYRSRVYDHLDRMAAGTIEIDKLAKPETREQFIETVKNYINERGVYNGYMTEFSGDYTKIRKIDVALSTPAEKLQAEIRGNIAKTI